MEKTFNNHYSPSNELGIDEMMTKFKGRSRAKQYNPAKPIKRGYKTFALCESQTGYVLRFHPYQGKETEREDESLAHYAITKLLQPAKYHHCGHIVGMDNWFSNMPSIERWKEEWGIDLNFTLRRGRKGFPTRDQLTLGRVLRGTYIYYFGWF